jgi:DNA-binding MarR family transcriptional regulator
MRIYAFVTRCAERELRKEGLTLPRFDVIAHLGAGEECFMQDTLCEKLFVTKGNISGLIDRMVEEGLVSREEDPENRRCNRIQLTDQGKKIFQKVVPEHEDYIDGVFSALTRQEQTELKELLRKLIKSMCGKVK